MDETMGAIMRDFWIVIAVTWSLIGWITALKALNDIGELRFEIALSKVK